MAKARTREIVRSVLSGDVSKARAALLQHVQNIVVEPDGKIFVAPGVWDFVRSDLWMVPGARNERIATFALP